MILSTLLLVISLYLIVRICEKPQEPKRIPVKVRRDKFDR